MTKQGFQKFVDELSKSESLQAELRGLANDDGRVAMDDVASFASERGYDFQVEDVSGELSEDELESVAGGASYVFPKVEISLTSNEFLKLDSYDGSLFLTFQKV